VSADANTHIKGFADAYYKGEEGIAEDIALKGVVCYKDIESV
jgi:hypothetical protein